MSYNTRPDADDGFGQIIPLYREYKLTPVNPQSRALQQFLEEHLLDQSLKSRASKFSTSVDLELQSHHPMIRNAHLMFLISRGKSRFVDEVHNPNAEIRSSADLLSELQKAEGG